ncbi:MAG: PorP/SprF family type IX secretion system membrane protein [Bacteroidetes bacterium]|nr:PorP/SprF family type IX secretion system membrane protein [Bacteroidota bacterium]
MNKLKYSLLLLLVATTLTAAAQGIHFSQYYNAPLLVNPANTALMSENDYRLGVNYRSQWTKVPVPYKTFSAYADLEAFKAKNLTNWLGMGLAFYNDVAGDGDLKLTKTDVLLAYHVQTSETFMISAGFSAGYAGRSVDYNKLYFDVQWDGFKFDKSAANHEQINIIQTSFVDVGAGINFSYFPNEAVFIKGGFGMSHINQPKETFYNLTNELGMRPTANIDATLVMTEMFTLNPSVYYSAEKGAKEIMFGTLLDARVIGKDTKTAGSLIVGAHYRYNEALALSFGVQWSGLRVMSTYDYTTSSLGSDVKGNGAIEFGLVYMGMYGEHRHAERNMNCPRFY